MQSSSNSNSSAPQSDLMSGRPQLTPEAVKDISQRLSADQGLRLPASLQRDLTEPVTPQKRKEYVTTLLEKDPGVFLERYASKLSQQEIAQFEPLRDDYEVDFYLKLAEDEELAARSGLSATVKNRRLAQLNRLVDEGKYFSEEAMRNRAPLLHQQYIGQRPVAVASSAPTLSGTLLRQHDEQEHQNKLQQQKEQEAMVEEEEESSSEEAEEDGQTQQSKHDTSGLEQPSANKHGDASADPQNTEDFLALMHQRFLNGADHEYVDYSSIDKNATLDDDWAAQAEGDAQEKYFDAD